MAKSLSEEETEPHNSHTPKKSTMFKLFEPSLSIISFFFVTICVICCLSYVDYTSVVGGVSNLHVKFQWRQDNNDGFVNDEAEKVEFLSENGGKCDVFDGDWVWDESYPLYESTQCGFIDGGFRCTESGRPDNFYTKWRWQPKHCNLPRFDAKLMLEKLRNKRIVFVGDSIGRNQWESLLCMLASGVPDQKRIYEVNGSPITKHKGYLVFKFEDYNSTIEYYRSPFLVVQSRPPVGAPKVVKSVLRVDQLDWNSRKWRDADVLVFNTGHWWNYEKTLRGGCYFQVGEKIITNMTEDEAYGRSIETVLDWVDKQVNTSKTQVFFRTYAPVHFRGGDWKTGGACHMETLPELGDIKVSSEKWPKLAIASEVLGSHSDRSKLKDINVLNITFMSHKRKDGHSSVYYLGPGARLASIHRQDCSHWCLPGVPDSWNELLYALFVKRELVIKTKKSTEYEMQTVSGLRRSIFV